MLKILPLAPHSIFIFLNSCALSFSLSFSITRYKIRRESREYCEKKFIVDKIDSLQGTWTLLDIFKCEMKYLSIKDKEKEILCKSLSPYSGNSLRNIHQT